MSENPNADSSGAQNIKEIEMFGGKLGKLRGLLKRLEDELDEEELELLSDVVESSANTEVEVEEEEIEEGPKYNSDPRIELTLEDTATIIDKLNQQNVIRQQLGEAILVCERQKANATAAIEQINVQINERLVELESIYSVDPDLEYTLNLPEMAGGSATFVRED